MSGITPRTRGRGKPAVAGTARWLLRGGIGLAVNAGLLFGSAGTFAWPGAWAYLALQLLSMLYLIFGVHDAKLFAERSRWHQDARVWDKFLLPFAIAPIPLALVIAGLDFGRFHWSPPIGWSFKVLALFAMAFGLGLVLWAMKVNTYFSHMVRIQRERGHRVVTSGPYRYVRHPGYSGHIVAMLALPILLGSYWVLVAAIPSIVVIVIRTALEDRMLQDELAGYRDYALRTRYRLFPRVW